MSRLIAWHFTGETLLDGRPIPPVGEWLVHDGPIEMCKSGLHASIKVLVALQYAPGEMCHLVECEGVVAMEPDKLVCRRRKILASVDATEILRAFARRQALSVIHLWDAPEMVVRYLSTGDESIRAAAWDAARAAARNAARAAARVAAWAAARAAAWDAAWAAARAAARNAAWAAAWAAEWAAARAAARNAAWAAAWAAEWAAARAAARDAAWDAARAAAWDAAWDAANRDLEAHLLYAMGSRHPEVVEATRG